MGRQALILVDVQNDFCPGGSLAVRDGDQVVPVLQTWAERLSAEGGLIVTTQDAHPPHHISFQDRGGPWPPHCVAGTPGFALHPDLKLPPHTAFHKGFLADVDAYSGFEGKQVEPDTGQDLADYLRQNQIDHLYVGGLATDYCVKATVLDALNLGFAVTVLVDAVRGVNVHPEDSAAALDEMARQGAVLQ